MIGWLLVVACTPRCPAADQLFRPPVDPTACFDTSTPLDTGDDSGCRVLDRVGATIVHCKDNPACAPAWRTCSYCVDSSDLSSWWESVEPRPDLACTGGARARTNTWDGPPACTPMCR